MLIASLPAIQQERLVEEIIEHPLVDQVRYNSGIPSPYSARETLERLSTITSRLGKQLWLDLKGRQLRITQWAAPNYGKIILNHEVEIDCPARIYFRGDEWSEIKVVRGDVIFVDPPPRYAVGAGQAINIEGNNLKIKGYFTPEDHLYLEAARALGLDHFMLSFVESRDDISDFYEQLNSEQDDLKIALKIESIKGLDFARQFSCDEFPNCTLMAARDDLYINIGSNKALILSALADIISRDRNAILASRIFSGLENSSSPSLADFADLGLMSLLGYEYFLLSDGICARHFDKAIRAWQDYRSISSNWQRKIVGDD
jgi:pyruvate kinase